MYVESELVTRGFAFSIHAGRDGFQALREAWQRIESETRLAFYQSFDWFRCLLDHLADEDDEYLFILATHDGAPVAILPLQSVREKRLGLTYRYLQVPNHPHIVIRDIALRADVSRKHFFTALVAYLRKAAPYWDALRIVKVPVDSSLNELCSSSYGLLLRSEQAGTTYIISCAQTAGKNMGHLTGRFKRNLRRLRKRADGIGPTRLVVCRRDNDVEDAIRLFIDVENDSWKSDSGSSIASDPRLVAYYEAVARMMRGTHECQINLLKIGNETVAAQFGIRSRSTFFMLKIGYRQEYSDIGPGNLLLEDVIEYFSSDEEIQRISLVTAPPWGEKWKSHEIGLMTHLDYRPSASGVLACLGARLKTQVGRRREAAAATGETPELSEQPIS